MGRCIWIFALFVLSLGVARAQTNPAASDGQVQIQLSEAEIQEYLASQADFAAAIADAPKSGAVADPKFVAELESIATKHNFKNYDEFDAVAANIALVLLGVDDKTKLYIGAQTKLKNEMAALQADVKVPTKVKAAELAEFESGLRATPPTPLAGNIELVMKYYDQLVVDPFRKP